MVLFGEFRRETSPRRVSTLTSRPRKSGNDGNDEADNDDYQFRAADKALHSLLTCDTCPPKPMAKEEASGEAGRRRSGT